MKERQKERKEGRKKDRKKETKKKRNKEKKKQTKKETKKERQKRRKKEGIGDVLTNYKSGKRSEGSTYLPYFKGYSLLSLRSSCDILFEY